MNGVSEKEFGPEEPMTREQFAVVMDRYSKLVDSRIETAVNRLRKEIECRKEG